MARSLLFSPFMQKQRLGCLIVCVVAACTSEGTSGGNRLPLALLEQARQNCFERINAFRATENLPPYERWLDGEDCTDEQSGLDATSESPHGHFAMCGEWAQNTCPGWGSPDQIVSDCLQGMWDEGPGSFDGHGHYLNMSSTEYARVACGFFQLADGSVWSNQNFQ